MQRMRKKILATLLATAIFFSNGGISAYAALQNGQEMGTETLQEAKVSENTLTLDEESSETEAIQGQTAEENQMEENGETGGDSLQSGEEPSREEADVVEEESGEAASSTEEGTETETISAEEDTQTEEAPSKEDETETEIVPAESSFPVGEAETPSRVEAAAAGAISVHTEFYINPLYRDVIDENQLKAELEQIKAQYAAGSLTAQSTGTYATLEEAVEYLKGQLTARSGQISLSLSHSLVEGMSSPAQELFNRAIVHTESTKGWEGDALRWVHAGWNASMSTNGVTYTITYTISYYTTKEQEDELTAKVTEAMTSMALEGKSDYDKVKAIHDYVCNAVDYDFTNLNDDTYVLKYTAYAALCQGTAVCQGYAIAFYRLCKEAGLSVRILTGTGNGGAHAWNIVKIGDVYYNIDCTWDGQDAATNYNFFLQNEADFADHIRDAEYATEEFYNTYPMAAYSYGKEPSENPDTPGTGENTGALNLTNLQYEFTTLDGGTVSTTSAGQPKLLFFFGAACGNCRYTMSSLSQQVFDGVDIYAIEINSSSREDVENFKAEYANGNQEIVFSQDTTGNNNRAMWSYLSAAGMSTSNVYLPVIVYIDANDKIQYVTTSVSTGETVKENLGTYCGYKEKIYQIIYHLDGGINHPDNPVEFKFSTETITLNEATKADHLFKGWYTDGGFTLPISQIAKGTKGDIHLYAKFVQMGYTVSFNLMGHGNAIPDYTGITAGHTITEPEKPTAEGYLFGGWYKDEECREPWNFEVDTVQKDTILYAKWLVKAADSSFLVDEIKPLYYTGKALKPSVQVYDGETLLRPNKDYKLTYKNNIHANVVPVGRDFNASLPHVIIEGKGNYSGKAEINFSILPAVIGDGSANPAKGVKLNFSDQLLTNTKKAINPFKSIKFATGMRLNQDFTLLLEVVKAFDASGKPLTAGPLGDSLIPAGAWGSFKLTITGTGNYTGSIVKTITVTDKSHMMKNASIALGKNIRMLDFEYYVNQLRGELPAGYYDSAAKQYYAVVNGAVDTSKSVNKNDIFTVKCGTTMLIRDKDYVVSYANNGGAGTANMTITGIGEYAGSKTVSFKLTGKAFNQKTVRVEGLQDADYTGNPITQDQMKLIYSDGASKETELTCGIDYTVAYTRNIHKGKATITFTAVGDSGYQGSFKKTFTIRPLTMDKIQQAESMSNISVAYEKGGVRPVDQVVLTNPSGKALVYGRDYTLSYKNNKAVAAAGGDQGPIILIKGKGNYSGQVEKPFTIQKASLKNTQITISSKGIAYTDKKADDYQYRPVITIKDNGKTLSPKTEYTVEYVNNTQADYKAYYMDKTQTDAAKQPKVIIRAKEGSSYDLDTPIELELPVYRVKLTSKNLHVVISEASYTGGQAKPEVKVYYASDNQASRARGLTNEQEILKLGLKKLDEKDYTLEYGKNLFSGANKGTVKITGIGAEYGGTVSFRFTIARRPIEFKH